MENSVLSICWSGVLFLRFSYCQAKNFSMNNMINGLKICTFSCGLTIADSWCSFYAKPVRKNSPFVLVPLLSGGSLLGVLRQKSVDVEPLQPSVSYTATTQCPLDSTREMMIGPPYILKWAEIKWNLLYTPLHSQSCWDFSLSLSVGMKRREKSEL